MEQAVATTRERQAFGSPDPGHEFIGLVPCPPPARAEIMTEGGTLLQQVLKNVRVPWDSKMYSGKYIYNASATGGQKQSEQNGKTGPPDSSQNCECFDCARSHSLGLP